MIQTTKEIDQMLSQNAVVAMAVSGGKDSTICALETSKYLDSIGHTGARILIHSDLGSVEWKNSAIVCERLADRLQIPLITVQRKAGGMMQRWEVRWANNVKRYMELSCVKLILPWSTPSMRFCTSELKTAVICSELTQRFPGKTIINVVGIRRAESCGRANAPISKINKKLERKNGTNGIDWNPILEMSTEDIFLAHKKHNFPLHEAYLNYGSSRVSCAYCIMGNKADLIASTTCPDNQDIYREMCELEISSGFSFQSNLWLSDIAPDLLSQDQIKRLPRAKEIAILREKFESQIPKHLLYTNNFPEFIPTYSEAVLLAEIRKQTSALYNFNSQFLEPVSLIQRYEELMAEKNKRQARSK